MGIIDFLNTYSSDKRDGEGKPDPQIYFNRGIVISQNEQFGMAISQFSKAISLDKYFWNAYRERAKLYNRVKEYDLALKDLYTLDDHNKLEEQDLRDITWYSLILGKYEVTIYFCDKILKNSPKDIEILERKAKALFAENNFKIATQTLTFCIDLAKEKATFDQYFLRGVCLSNLNDFNFALKDFERCLIWEPSNQKTYFYLAGCYRSTGRPEMQQKFARLAVEGGDENARQFL